MRRTAGFTLLEMIVASMIMAIAVVGLLSAISGSTRNAARLRDYDRMVQLARLRMNELLVDQSLRPGASLGGTFDPQITGGLEAGWRAALTPFEKAPQGTGGMRMVLDRMQLQIWWTSGRDKKTFALEAFRKRLLTPEEP